MGMAGASRVEGRNSSLPNKELVCWLPGVLEWKVQVLLSESRVETEDG